MNPFLLSRRGTNLGQPLVADVLSTNFYTELFFMYIFFALTGNYSPSQ